MHNLKAEILKQLRAYDAMEKEDANALDLDDLETICRLAKTYYYLCLSEGFYKDKDKDKDKDRAMDREPSSGKMHDVDKLMDSGYRMEETGNPKPKMQ